MTRSGSTTLSLWCLTTLVFALHAGVAFAGIHTWDVNEVFSNADGTIQFVELWEAGGGATEFGVGNGTITSNTQTHSFGNGPVGGDTGNKYYLIATQAFADLPGAPTPDEIIPAGKIPFFDVAGDTVAFGTYDSWTFGAVPTGGTQSLHKLTGQGVNSPTNYAGATGSVDASPGGGPTIPVLAPGAAILLLGSVSAAGFLALRRRATLTSS